MKKRILVVISMMIMMITGMFSTEIQAEETVISGTCGENLSYTLDKEGTLTISGKGEIGYRAFSDENISFYRDIKKVIIEEGITLIDHGAFKGCDNMRSISFPASLTDIGLQIFYNCNSLTHIEVDGKNETYCSEEGVLFNKNKTTLILAPRGIEGVYQVPDGVTVIAGDAFERCQKLTNVILPDSVTEIGLNAFWDCSKLENINLPADVKEIAILGFGGCVSLKGIEVDEKNEYYSSENGILFNKDKTELISFPRGYKGSYEISEDVTKIGEYAFYECISLTEVVVPDSVTEIGKGAFFSCINIKNIKLPSMMTEVEDYVFSSCDSLTDIKLPLGITKIGKRSFSGCTSLTSIDLPSGITEMGDSVFWSCYRLKNVKLPVSLTKFGAGVFAHCSSLLEIEIDQKNAYYCTEDGILFNKAKTELVAYPTGREGAYQVPSGIREIASEAFKGSSKLTCVIIPESVIRVGEEAFAENNALSKVILPVNVTEMGDAVFAYCDNLFVWCFENSVAHEYAVSYGLSLKCINEELYNSLRLYRVTFDVNGGTELMQDTILVLGGDTIIYWPVTEKNGNRAEGWYIDKVCKTRFTSDMAVTSNITLYANWKMQSDGEAIEIERTSIAGAKVVLTKNSYIYDGGLKMPSVKSVTLGQKVLKEVADYLVSYKNNKDIGKATVIITGVGEYKGKVKKTFTIRIKKGVMYDEKDCRYKVLNNSEVALTYINDERIKRPVIPNTVTIGKKVFKVTTIADRALKNKKIFVVTIGSNVKKIGKEAFKGCSNLRIIKINSKKIKTIGKNALKGITKNAKIRVPANKVSLYRKLLANKGQSNKVSIIKSVK